MIEFRHHAKPGQALLEYVLAFAGLLVVVGVMWGFVHVSMRSAVRAENLVSNEYP